ncbi:MAG: DUF1501 domain-containing protein [Planctomycetota bacterium]
MNQRYKRRQFLTQLSAASGVMAFGATAPQVLCHAAAAGGDKDRVLVVVEMAGGNDGLNSVIPHSDPAYKKARPKLGISKAACLPIDNEVGLHPAMTGFAELLEQNRFGVIQGVGYENPNRSHFESMDIWHSCLRKNQARDDGWIGRYLQANGAITSGDPAALHLGADKQPFALTSRDVRVPSIQSLDEFRLLDNGSVDLRKAIGNTTAAQSSAANELLGFVQQSTTSAVEASDRLESAGMQYKPAKKFPNSGLGKKLGTVAKLIAGGIKSTIYYVQIDGFDTHANQPDAHAALLRQVSDSVSSLITDLNQQGHGDRVMVMCFSEFGRRVAENASDGTDHGTAGPIFLAGNAVRSGLIGKHPSLTDLDQGDLKFHTDFRAVYASVLENWLGCESESILGGRFDPVSILA